MSRVHLDQMVLKNQASSRGGSLQTRVHLDQMVLLMAKREAGSRERWPKTLNGELKTTLEAKGPGQSSGIVTA
jgi:hypothetical protein